MSTGTTTHNSNTGPHTSPQASTRTTSTGHQREAQQPANTPTTALLFPEAGVRLLPQNSLGLFASTMAGYRERLQEAARELASQYDQMNLKAQRRLGTLCNPADYPGTLDVIVDLEVSYPTIEPPRFTDWSRS